MACETIGLPNGSRAIVCGARKRRRCACGRPAALLCDWKMPAKKSGICDAPICDRCAASPAPDKDLCPKHAAAFEQWKTARAAAGATTETNQ